MNNKIINTGFALLLLAFIISCSPEYEATDNGIYFGEAQEGNSKKITIKNDGAETNLYLSLAAPKSENVSATVVSDTQILDEFNKKNGTNYLPLPEGFYTLSSNECIIEAGKLSSPLIDIKVNAFDSTLLESEKYAIPVKIASSDGINILEPSSGMVIICDKIIYTKAFFSSGGATGASPTYAYIVQEGDALTDNLQSWTIEFLVYAKSFSLNKHIMRFRDDNNKATLFSRFGEYSRPVDEIQFKILNVPIYGTKLFTPQRWYHVALTNDGTNLKLYQDGVLDAVLPKPEPGTKDTWREFHLANGSGGAMSEFRIWNTVRTQAEIANNMYAINPETEGLISYWKINEGTGGVGSKIIDHTNNGRDLTLKKSGTWRDVTFPPEY